MGTTLAPQGMATMKKFFHEFAFYMLLASVTQDGNPGVLRSLRDIENARTIRAPIKQNQ